MKGTLAALIARGIGSDKAEALTRAGLTLAKLQMKRDADLVALGLSANEIPLVRRGGRPPIPSDTLTKLLFDNRYQCCVCRNPTKPFIVHHIQEWSVSYNHDISNLVVLCLEHHDKAHSKSSLSQNLDATALASAKEKWEDEVKRLDARSVIDAMSRDYAHWAFINEMRLFELAGEHRVEIDKLSNFRRAKADGIVDGRGNPLPTRTATFYKYEGPAILTRYAFMKELLHEVIEGLPFINLSDHLDKGVIIPSVLEGDFIICQGRHSFKPLSDLKKGIGQDCRGTRRANDVEISFVFDRWGATSSSSRADWLAGTKSATSLIQVRNVCREDGLVKITGTVIAIASYANSLKKREYAQSWLEWRPRRRNGVGRRTN